MKKNIRIGLSYISSSFQLSLQIHNLKKKLYLLYMHIIHKTLICTLWGSFYHKLYTTITFLFSLILYDKSVTVMNNSRLIFLLKIFPMKKVVINIISRSWTISSIIYNTVQNYFSFWRPTPPNVYSVPCFAKCVINNNKIWESIF